LVDAATASKAYDANSGPINGCGTAHDPTPVAWKQFDSAKRKNGL
jgi:hypothetical protein